MPLLSTCAFINIGVQKNSTIQIEKVFHSNVINSEINKV